MLSPSRALLALVAAALTWGAGAAAQTDQSIDSRDSIYFSGTPAAELGGVDLPSIADRYLPLSSMNSAAREQAFLMWLGLIYFKSNPSYEPNGSPAREDPILVLQFNKQYEAGAWRQLNRGLTLEETAFVTEYSSGKRFTALINASGPRLRYRAN